MITEHSFLGELMGFSSWFLDGLFCHHLLQAGLYLINRLPFNPLPSKMTTW